MRIFCLFLFLSFLFCGFYHFLLFRLRIFYHSCLRRNPETDQIPTGWQKDGLSCYPTKNDRWKQTKIIYGVVEDGAYTPYLSAS